MDLFCSKENLANYCLFLFIRNKTPLPYGRIKGWIVCLNLFYDAVGPLVPDR